MLNNKQACSSSCRTKAASFFISGVSVGGTTWKPPRSLTYHQKKFTTAATAAGAVLNWRGFCLLCWLTVRSGSIALLHGTNGTIRSRRSHLLWLSTIITFNFNNLTFVSGYPTISMLLKLCNQLVVYWWTVAVLNWPGPKPVRWVQERLLRHMKY